MEKMAIVVKGSVRWSKCL